MELKNVILRMAPVGERMGLVLACRRRALREVMTDGSMTVEAGLVAVMSWTCVGIAMVFSLKRAIAMSAVSSLAGNCHMYMLHVTLS